MPVLQWHANHESWEAPHKDPGRPQDSLLQGMSKEVHTEESRARAAIMTGESQQDRCVNGFGRELIEMGFQLVDRTTQFVARVRLFYYQVALSSHRCTACDGALAMIADSRARCGNCHIEVDPTVVFQRCGDCGGPLRLRIRRYQCAACGADASSRYVFDGLIFDREYFRRRMEEHRERKREQLDRIRAILSNTRSPNVLIGGIDLRLASGLTEALDGLVQASEPTLAWLPRWSFDLNRYEEHVRSHVGTIALTLDELPPLNNESRLDRIWRFVAIVFLAHAGVIATWQDGPDVMVIQSETDREGQGIS